MKALVGKKLNMTQIFSAKGERIPATLISIPALVVTQVKTKEKDGYIAIQLGYGVQKESRLKKPQKGHAEKLGFFKGFKEFRTTDSDKPMALGDKVLPTVFEVGDVVAISSISKGKGFQGGVRRHHFKGGSRTHGQKHSEREVGSIGGGGRAGGRVAKGMRMPGRMGGTRVTTKNLEVLQVDESAGHILVSGSIAGARGALVEIRSV
ncbi:MAG: 50S ribosomal protein L3 [Candidatus Taylorbacteria bacterium RIFCSPHIGHO2_01_FULL_45_63]|uniref:50S ribosomal protein L3 n=1 Tax=Candidatus Taylorbacteria bacterium RIFCSPHIGHO2_02_FULL_45_35 TaxID=1802311 RepID=A0A1G2MV33_9BACT|nr:MAG: 50S ribosomal protein L3 [Candidatus Taylorbacteria bacterium RIFCSPHIGHO2_01_FULL_45_63]OHA26811.1 MAG: 50S ribosomal protein L3 [Candidatus Taylorbacteria bacterium RIFCSPHIGHO2_02_FULL_45_35]OHA33628.1 MAG: 50S ribosomal protein L3 [Candidatus Taylorbacteria bacterium RIFCSPLOWO2_01_FULL_45_34b]